MHFTYAVPLLGACSYVLEAARLNLGDRLATQSHNSSLGPVTKKPPDIGRLRELYAIEAYIGTFGQASVWKGREIGGSGRQIIIRFPYALCEHGTDYCFVRELYFGGRCDICQESRTICALSKRAMERNRGVHMLDGGSNLPGDDIPPFSECLLSVSSLPADAAENVDVVALEVWTYAGDVTLLEAFFVKTGLGALSLEDKREVLYKVSVAIATLATKVFQADEGHAPCCCPDAPDALDEDCTFEPVWGRWDFKSVQKCPFGFEASRDPEACGPIVHHDIKFDNIMLRSGPQTAAIRSAPSSAKAHLSSNHDTGLLSLDAHAQLGALGASLRPVIIDFGAASLCKRGQSQALAFSEDWLPYWLDRPDEFSKTDCWKHDTYALGIMWLVVELLAKLPPSYLLSHLCSSDDSQARRKGHLVDVMKLDEQYSSRNFGGVCYSCRYENPDGFTPNAVSCWSREENRRKWADAMKPILKLVKDIRGSVLTSEHLATPNDFVEAVQHFVGMRNGRNGQRRRRRRRRELLERAGGDLDIEADPSGENMSEVLPLIMPPRWVLRDMVYDKLQEHSPFPRFEHGSLFLANKFEESSIYTTMA